MLSANLAKIEKSQSAVAFSDVNSDLSGPGLDRAHELQTHAAPPMDSAAIHLSPEQTIADRIRQIPGLYCPSEKDFRDADAITPTLREIHDGPYLDSDAIKTRLREFPEEATRAALLNLVIDPKREQPIAFGIRQYIEETFGPRQTAILATYILERPESPAALKSEAIGLIAYSHYMPRATSALHTLVCDTAAPADLRAEAAVVLAKLGKAAHFEDLAACITPSLSHKQAGELFKALSDGYEIKALPVLINAALNESLDSAVRAQALEPLQYIKLAPEQLHTISASLIKVTEFEPFAKATLDLCEAQPADEIRPLLKKLADSRPDDRGLQGKLVELEAQIQHGPATVTPVPMQLVTESLAMVSDPQQHSEQEIRAAFWTLHKSAVPDITLARYALEAVKADAIEPYMAEMHLNRGWTRALANEIASSPELMRKLGDLFVTHAETADLPILNRLAADPEKQDNRDLTLALVRLGQSSGFERLAAIPPESLKSYDHAAITRALLESSDPKATSLLLDRLTASNEEWRDLSARECTSYWLQGEAKRDLLMQKLNALSEGPNAEHLPVNPRDYAQALKESITQKMELPFRYHPSSLISSTQSIVDGLPSQENIKVAAFFVAHHDDLNAIHGVGAKIRACEVRGISPLIFELKGVDDLIAADATVKRLLGSRKGLIAAIEAHGAPDGIAFGASDPAQHKDRTSDTMLGFKDKERLKANQVFSWLDPKKGSLPVGSCSVAGNFDNSQPDMLKFLAEIVPEGVVVIGNSSPIVNKGTEYIFSRDDAIIDKRYESMVGGRRVRLRA